MASKDYNKNVFKKMSYKSSDQRFIKGLKEFTSSTFHIKEQIISPSCFFQFKDIKRSQPVRLVPQTQEKVMNPPCYQIRGDRAISQMQSLRAFRKLVSANGVLISLNSLALVMTSHKKGICSLFNKEHAVQQVVYFHISIIIHSAFNRGYTMQQLQRKTERHRRI